MENNQLSNPGKKQVKDTDFILDPETVLNDPEWNIIEKSTAEINWNDDQGGNFSYFDPPITNTTPRKTVICKDVYEEITSFDHASETNDYRDLLEKFRDLLKEHGPQNHEVKKLKKQARDIKSTKFPYVTPGGTFRIRSEARLIQSSGLMVLDLDDLDNLTEVKDRLINDKILAPKLIFTSPGGKGLKVVTGITPTTEDLNRDSKTLGRWWESFNHYFSIHYNDIIAPEKPGEFIDGACKDLSRACFLCFDPEAWHSDNTKSLNEDFITEYTPPDVIKKTQPKPKGLIPPHPGLSIEECAKSHLLEPGINHHPNFLSFVGACIEIPGIQPEVVIEYLNDRPTLASSDSSKADRRELEKLVYDAFKRWPPATSTPTPETIPMPNYGNNPFPVEAFPEPLQDVINEINRVLLAPIDFLSAAVLWNTSVAIGTTYKAYANKGRPEPAILYITLVGSPGTNKTFPIKFLMKDIQRKDEESYKKYMAEYGQWTVDLQNHKKTDGPPPSEPLRNQQIIMDATPEALLDVLQHNPRGMGGYYDELTGWYGNFNKYNKGSEKSMWLSGWNGGQYTVNRKKAGNVFISDFFVSIIGGIQPDPLKQLGQEMGRDGTIDRFLFAILNNEPPGKFNDEQIDPDVINDWNFIISRVTEANTSGASIELPLNQAAKSKWIPWHDNLQIKAREEPDAIAGIYMKMVAYSIRFALILELLNWACSEETSPPKEISAKSVEGSLKLCKYFTNTAIRVSDIISGGDGMNFKTEDQRNIYNELPNTFTRNDAKKIAEKYGVTDRTLTNWLNDKSLYKRVKHGQYDKI